MKKTLIRTLAFLLGAGQFMFFYWLAGNDFPTERGFSAVFYLFESVCFGTVGVSVSIILELE